MWHQHKHRHPKSDGLMWIAFWQLMSFVLLILLIWVNETMDLASLWFGTLPGNPDVFRGCVLTIATIIVAIVATGHAYVQQKRIIKGLLTVCSQCHKIRIDEKMWERVDDYITEHSLALISHGLCPHCYEAMKKEVDAMNRPNRSDKPEP
jgi:hypothetical protein